MQDFTSIGDKGNNVIKRYTIRYILDPHNRHFSIFKSVIETLAWIHWLKQDILRLRVLRYGMPCSSTDKLDLQWSCDMIRVSDVV